MSNMPSLHLTGTAWNDAPPNPLEEPDLYDSVIGRRSAAYLLDVLIIAVLAACGTFVISLAGILSAGLLTPLGIVALILLPIAYHTFFIGQQGATPGMLWLDLEVRSWTGAPPDFSRAFLMTALFYITVTITSWLVLIVALFNDHQRTVHDYLAGTVVVRRSRLAKVLRAGHQ